MAMSVLTGTKGLIYFGTAFIRLKINRLLYLHLLKGFYFTEFPLKWFDCCFPFFVEFRLLTCDIYVLNKLHLAAYLFLFIYLFIFFCCTSCAKTFHTCISLPTFQQFIFSETF